jgi:hypothetical protein
MYVNNYKINLSTMSGGTTATTINIPISMEYQLVDTAELIDRVFVETETENAINPILNYDMVRFMPINPSDNPVTSLTYDIRLFTNTGVYGNFYSDIGFVYDDVKFSKNSFNQSFLRLSFYDSDDPMIQNLVGYMTLFCRLASTDLLSGGTAVSTGLPKPINQIPIKFTVENPLINKRGFGEGFHLYYYKDSLNIGETKYLYMKASFNNAKTGKKTNLMVKNTPQNIENLVHELYTRYKITRTTTGYFYEIDDLYQGNGTSGVNNVTYFGNGPTIDLYEVKAN